MTENRRRIQRALVFSLCLLPAAADPSVRQENRTGRPTILILVRHAEKARDGSQDPPLTEVGRRRADEWAAALRHLGLAAVYSTPYRRTLETAAPAAAAGGFPVQTYSPHDPDFLERVLADHRGETVLIVGHSNTVPGLVNRLAGADLYADLEDDVYDSLFIVSLPEHGEAGILRLSFGEPASPAPKTTSAAEGPGDRVTPPNRGVKSGLDVLRENRYGPLRGRRVGIITNQSGIASDGLPIADLLAGEEDIRVTALFAPEHGIRGDLPDGFPQDSFSDPQTGIRVWSLYGEFRKPTPDMLAEVDVLVYDIQDVGVRFYTYIATLGLAMQAAAELGKTFMVLDRPDPINGRILEGPILETELASFVGPYPLPIRYGMTPGELALMIKGEMWRPGLDRLDLVIVPMEGWRRDMWYDETGLPWIKPSPNIPSLLTATAYPGMCLVEALNLSEGRGTMRPFEICGAPWIEAEGLAETMNAAGLPGVRFNPIAFTPVGIPGAGPDPKYSGRNLRGLELIVSDREVFRPVSMMVYLLSALHSRFPERIELNDGLERLIGSAAFRGDLLRKRPPSEIIEGWEKKLEGFRRLRAKYLLYQ